MAKPVEINIPTEASDNAQAVIPSTEVPRVANALRNTGLNLSVDSPDEELIAEAIMQLIRNEVISSERSEAARNAIEQEITLNF